jgi:hypothetical protein
MAVYFQERQTYTQWWLWAIAGSVTIGINALFINGVITQLVFGIPWTNEPLSDEMLVTISVIVLSVSTGLSLLFFVTVMEVRIDNRAIEYRYVPFIREWRRIEREAVREIRQRRNYFYGHGVKRGFDGSRMLSIKGTVGIEVTLDGGKKIFFGTQQPEEFKSAVEKMVQSNKI